MRNKKHIKGDLAELIAAEFFIDKGFYVFRNMSQHGPADMTVLDPDGNIMLVDIKALSLRNKMVTKLIEPLLMSRQD